jgi:glutathione transport system permease protein
MASLPASVADVAAGERVRTPWTEFWRKFRRRKVALVAGGFVVLLVVVAIVAPLIVPYDAENYFDYDKLNAPPSVAHWFGVDALGRDIFSRILMGARISLAAGFLSVAIGAIVGTLLGLLAGDREGWWDRIVMRICDVLFAFPGILLAIAIVALVRGGLLTVIIAIMIPAIPQVVRLVRARVIAVFWMRDDGRPDAKLLCVPATDPRQAHLQDLGDVPMHQISEIWHFFEIYEALEPGKSAVPPGSGRWERRKEALLAVEDAQRRFAERAT